MALIQLIDLKNKEITQLTYRQKKHPKKLVSAVAHEVLLLPELSSLCKHVGIQKKHMNQLFSCIQQQAAKGCDLLEKGISKVCVQGASLLT